MIKIKKKSRNQSMPNKYTADIGCWERGKKVDLPNSHTLDGALREAQEILDITVFNPPIPDPFIVKIRLNGQTIWDYMNGAYKSHSLPHN